MNRIEAVALIINDQCIEKFQCKECSKSDCAYWYAINAMDTMSAIEQNRKIDPLQIVRLSQKKAKEWIDIFSLLEGGEN